MLERLTGGAPGRDSLAEELARRDAEVRSLHELTDILSASLDSERVAAEATGYAKSVLGSAGAALILAGEGEEGLRVAAGVGSLAGRAGELVEPSAGGLACDAIAFEEPRSGVAPPGGAVPAFGEVRARAVAAAPLSAHGVTAGVLVAVDPPGGAFSEVETRTLAAVAKHTALVLANARFFEMVQHGKRQWEAAFDALSEGIVILDDAGTILRANAGFARLVGARLPGVVGGDLCEELFGERHSLADLLAAARRSGRTVPLVRRSERLGRILQITAAPITAEAGEGSLVVAVDDITEQRSLEAQLIQSEKMATVGTLVSGVAHELNNPLTSIAGLAEFLLEQPEGQVPDRDHLRVIAEEAQRAASIVHSLLSFARKAPAAERERVSLAEVVERTLFLMGYELRLEGITVETALQPGLPAVLGDRHQLQQVVLNLLTNAAQALAALPAGLPRRVTVGAAAEGERVVLRVADTGLGIPADILPNIFSPFFTTKPQGEGTGLGLFISFGIVERHGGTLAAESRPGAGALFTLALPRAPEAHDAPARGEPVAAAPAAPPGKRILVVDDDPAVRRMVAALFSREGHAVDAVADGRDGIRLAREADYDLVIADRRACAGDVPFVGALRSARPEWAARVIVSTADVRPAPADAAADTRMLRKPFNLRDLRAAAAAVWEHEGHAREKPHTGPAARTELP